MRLLILHQAAVFGGAERTTKNLIEHLDRGLVRHLSVAAPLQLREHLPASIDAFFDTSGRIRHGWLSTARSLSADVSEAAGLIADASPDVVLGMMHYSATLATFGVKLKRLPVKTVGSFRGPVYEHMRRYEHGVRRKAFLSFVVGATARLADRMIVPSHGTAQELMRRFLGPASRTLVIPNGIDIDQARADAGAPANGIDDLPLHLPRLCVAARLSVEKDLGLLLEAFRRVQAQTPSSLIVVGDGPDRARLQGLAEQWGLRDRVRFLGHRANVYPYLAAADLYVHTCHFEGFGYTILEAMACGCPVVATDCPYGPREIIEENAFGVLVPMKDPGALAEAISRLLNDPGRRSRLAEQGLARARQLSIKRMVGSYEAAFRGLLARS